MVYGLFRALPGDRACLPPSPAKVASRKLDASVGASGPHDFAVRGRLRQRLRRAWYPSAEALAKAGSAPFVIGASASTASRPAAVTIACRPSVGRDGEGYSFDLGFGKTEIFLQMGLDRWRSTDGLICPSGSHVGCLTGLPSPHPAPRP
jgi:hypothetical protein